MYVGVGEKKKKEKKKPSMFICQIEPNSHYYKKQDDFESVNLSQ